MRKYIPIFIILLLGCFAILWSKGQFVISLGDFGFPQNRINEFLRMFYAWDSTSLGFLNFMILGFSMPYGIYLAVNHLLNISSVHSQIFWNYLIFSSLGLSMYFLVIQLIQDRSKYAAGLLAALFFMFNPWSAVNITMFIPFITFIPFVLGMYIRGLNSDKKLKYIVIISIIWCLISSFSLWNIRGFIFQWVIVIFYLLFFCLQNRKKILHALLFTFVLFIIYALLNSHWLILFVLNISKSVTDSAVNYYNINYTRLDSFRINSSTIPYALRMLDNWSMTANFKGVYYFPWLSFYQHPFLIFLGLLPLVTTLTSLLFVIKTKLKQYSNFFFFFLLLLFGLFISMGKNNVLTIWFADHIPLFDTLFSSPSIHGGIFIAIGYSVLIGYSFMFVYQHIKSSRIRSGVFLLCIVAIMIYGYPVWSGQFIPIGNKMLGAGRYQTPSYMGDLKNHTDREKLNYRIFPLPYSKLGYFAYNWAPKGFNGPDPLTNILIKPQVLGTGLGMQIADTTTKNIDKISFFRLASLLNVKYIMYKRDANLLHIKNNAWYTVPDQSFLNSLYQDTKNVSSFGQIDLIKIPDGLFLPKLYTPLRIISSNNITELPNIVSQKDYKARSAIYFNNHRNINSATEKTILEYRMINPTKYRIRVHSAQGSFPLVMSESFHEGWKIYLASPDNLKFEVRNLKLPKIQGTIQNDNLPTGPLYETWFKRPIDDNKNYLMVNGYANSWLMNTDKLCSAQTDCIKNADGSYDFELVIEFWPQRIYYFGLVISITTLIACITYLFITSSRRRSGSSL